MAFRLGEAIQTELGQDLLIEVGLQVFAPQDMIDTERPCLEVGEDAVDSGQSDVGAQRLDLTEFFP